MSQREEQKKEWRQQRQLLRRQARDNNYGQAALAGTLASVLADATSLGEELYRTQKLTPEERMFKLAESFPALRGKIGTRWDSRQLEDWAGVCSSGELHAVKFVLHVWNFLHPWACGPFEVTEAMGVWDDGNRAAFLAWAVFPWTA